MTYAGSEYTIIALMYLSMLIITATLFAEYATSKNVSKNKQLLAPCQITWQNPSYNLVFIAVPMGILMTCKLKIWWELGAIGLIPISENVFNMAIYAMKKLWQQHYIIVMLGFVCGCLQFLLIDFCYDNTKLPWRFIFYFCTEILLELVQHLYVCFISPDSDPLQRGGGFSTFKSLLIILMDLISIWSNVIYTNAVLGITNPKSVSPFMFDLISGLLIWASFMVSYILQCIFPAWRIWSANEMHCISEIAP